MALTKATRVRDTDVDMTFGNTLFDALPIITPEMVEGDTVSARVQSAVNTAITMGLLFRGKPGTTYSLEYPIAVNLNSASKFYADCTGSRFKQTTNSTMFTFTCDEDQLPLPATVEEVSYNLGDGSTNTKVMKVTCVGHGFTAEGQIGKIYSNDGVQDSDQANQSNGEFYTVGAVESADVFYTTGVFTDTYTTGIYVVKPGTGRVFVRGLACESEWRDDINASAINVLGLISPVFENTEGYDINGSLINNTSCYRAQYRGVLGRRIKNRPALNSYGYCFNDSSSYGTLVSGIDCIDARHAYTTTTGGTTDASNWRNRGRTMLSTVVDGFAKGCHGAFDTHAPCYRVSFIRCTSVSDFRGYATGGAGFQIRGSKCSIIDCESEGSKNGIAYSAVSHTGKDLLVIDGFRYVGPDGHVPFLILAKVGVESKIRISRVDVETRNNLVFDIRNGADVEVVDGTFTSNTTSNGSCIVSLAAGCKVRMYNPEVTFTASTGNSIVAHTGDDSHSRIEGGYVNGTQLMYLASTLAAYTANSSRIKGITLESALPGKPFNGVPSASLSKFSAQYETASGLKPLALRVSQVTSAGNISLSTQNSGHDMTFRIQCTVAGVIINEVSAGCEIGQKLTINNHSGSADVLRIVNNSAGLLALGSLTDIAVGRSVTLYWDGGNWRYS